jgi:hypothetical protein
MATTAQEMIVEAMSLIGAIAGGETATGQDMETCLYSLNSMLDSWATELPMIFVTREYTLTGYAAASFTMGVGGTISATRPTHIADGCFVRVQGVDYPIRAITSVEYAEIPNKSLSSDIPQYVSYFGDAPLAVGYLWPVPTGAGDIHIVIPEQVAEFTTISASANLAQGTRRAIAYSLAEEIAPKFGRQIDREVSRRASLARRNVRVSHYEVPTFGSGRRTWWDPFAGGNGGGSGLWDSGFWDSGVWG